MPD
ncbi:unnamed protein product [Linum tenue]|jgi:DNA-binding response OmpR family regulator